MSRGDNIEESLDQLMRAEVGAFDSPLTFVVAHTVATRKFASKPYVAGVLTSAVDKSTAKKVARAISGDTPQRITLVGPGGAFWDSEYDK